MNTKIFQTLANHAKTTILLKNEISELENLIFDSQNKILQFLENNFKLENFLNQPYTRYRDKWGSFNESADNGIFLEKHLTYYSYFKVHYIYTGQDLNKKLDTLTFNVDKHYILFVEYDCEMQEMDSIDTIELEKRLIYDHLIFEIKE